MGNRIDKFAIASHSKTDTLRGLLVMKMEIVALCDAATDYGGKLNILGAFDCLWVRQLPAKHPMCAIALRLRFNRVEEGEHRLRVNFVDEDGHLVMPSMDATLGVRFNSDDDTSIANLVFNIQQLKLSKFGQYSIDIAIDGRMEASLPLQVKSSPAPSSQPEAPAGG
jgi:hypothetical protein